MGRSQSENVAAFLLFWSQQHLQTDVRDPTGLPCAQRGSLEAPSGQQQETESFLVVEAQGDFRHLALGVAGVFRQGRFHPVISLGDFRFPAASTGV